jgi:hypothetical protein
MKPTFAHYATTLFFLLFVYVAADAQSTDPNFPTNVTANEINGTIKARDIGDPRSTSFYYALGGGQGDLFINVVSRNFAGDIDIFAADGLRPLTKMVVFADGNANETGRLIYLRKEEKLILRIQGRTPNDDPATFKIKFGGSFIALTGNDEGDTPKIAQAGEVNETGVRVNSVGTIVEVVPKPTPVKKPVETVAKVRATPAPKEEKTRPEPPTVSVTENIPAAPNRTEPGKANQPKPTKLSPAKKSAAEPATVFGGRKPKSTADRPKASAASPKTQPNKPAPKAPPAREVTIPDPLASIRLVVLLKDGNSIERPMSEVLKFSVDKGVLTVIAKDGSTVHYPILDVAKVTIE